MRKIFINLIFILLTYFCGCSSGGDMYVELSGGYFYRSEGSDLHDIINHSAIVSEIPANVLSFDYDNDFIIAKQQPTSNPDPLYYNTPKYDSGTDSIYFWLIVNKEKSVIGPMNESDFNKARIKYQVPDLLKLK